MTPLHDDTSVTFDNEFDLVERDLNEIIIKETYKKDKCIIWDKEDENKAYSSFVLKKNSQSKTLCDISFYKSSDTGKYVPRPTFKRVSLDGKIRKSGSKDKVSVRFTSSSEAYRFWELMGFLSSYKGLVDVGQFKSRYKVIAKDSYISEFRTKSDQQQTEDLKELVKIGELTSTNIKSVLYESRKKDLKGFYYLLMNKDFDGVSTHDKYSDKYGLRPGEEYIWHHFLKNHDWILGLNLDLRFIIDFIDEQKVGIESSKGKNSPQTDLLGITDFTTLVELKHSNTDIFKKNKSKGRANTWDFTSDFIEGVSQSLGQKFELDKSFEVKDFIDDEGNRLNKTNIHSIDPHTILLIGNKKREFPIDDSNDTNLIKNNTLQRFRRNNRNIDILTYDELFERAYQIVFAEKLSSDWYSLYDEKKLFPD
ncbi:Shedu anti-phage system protein SduA domain-containing protein [Gracilimonas sediminicola]|uniref:Shedu anti-phage system protein SduA domain-containing protein n=1 Tax=Gracilimonas sediminicola TaxID=2952158 RepID=UPI0038D35A59